MLREAAILTFNAPWPDAEAFANREWLVTNGLGGYASGTLSGVQTRRYHGVFMPNLVSPKGRHLLVSRLEEIVVQPQQQFQLAGGDQPMESAREAHLRWLQGIRIGANTAQWIYELPGVTLEKTIVMPYLRNTVLVHYRVLHSEHDAVTLQLRPFLPFRRQDAVLLPDDAVPVQSLVEENRLTVTHAESDLFLRMRLQGRLGAHFVTEAQQRIELLTREQARGYLHHECIVSPGYFTASLAVNQPLTFVATVEEWDTLSDDAPAVIASETRRLTTIASAVPEAEDPVVLQLVMAADQFLVRPEHRLADLERAHAHGHNLRSIFAGYHWFGDWGRDTMISLEGLLLCTGRHDEARATLLTYAEYVRDGLLPNLFPEGANAGLYHTVDASLWYFHSIHRYVQHTHDEAVIDLLLPVLRDIMRHHLAGTRFGIHVDPADGLLIASSPAQALTWMDAHAGEWIVTPRRGKPVEIQALWYNALRLMEVWTEKRKGNDREVYAQHATQARESFNKRFWNEAASCLFDVVDGEQGDDASLRPNQIFAISLDYPVLDPVRYASVLHTVRQHLLTPYGLRTLTREHPDYRSTYQGTLLSRDAAYHQGTVWPWLLGHFIDAWLKIDPDRAAARGMLAALPDHLREAGVGSISEVFDAQWPHIPHGCIAQAWSVAEALRAWLRTQEVSGDLSS